MVKCDFCEKTFVNKYSLGYHKRVHRSKKPYECEICEKTFSAQSVLSLHKITHKGSNSFVCYICGDKFNLMAELTSHKQMHTKDKSYSCDICQKSYRQRSVLLLHNKTAAHLKRKESLNIDFPIDHIGFVDCGESFKLEDIKEEISEEESVDDPLFKEARTTGDSDNNVEVKEEMIDDDSLCVLEIHNSGDGENNTVVDEIDIVEHKIEADN